MTDDDRDIPDTASSVGTPWRPPTRRVFVAMLGAAAAALVVRTRPTEVAPERPRSTWNGKTRWIGHC